MKLQRFAMRSKQWLCLLLVMCGVGCAKDPEVTENVSRQIILLKEGTPWIQVEGHSAQCEARLAGKIATLCKVKHKYHLQVNGVTYTIKQKDYGFKIYDCNDQVLLKFKRYPDKLKVAQGDEDPQAWTIRPKSGDAHSTKVKRGEDELGKITLYPERHELKAKDLEGQTLCRAESEGLSYVPMVVFMRELDVPKQLMAALVLFVMQP